MATPDVPARWIALAAEAIDGEESTAAYTLAWIEQQKADR